MAKRASKQRSKSGNGKQVEREVPVVRAATKVLAILCSDLHLSHKPPLARSAEHDWYGKMQETLREIEGMRSGWDCPIICVGDIFDRWNSPPELINFAIKWMPKAFYAIPGNHDLPLHQIDDLRKSAYWTLVQAGTITHLNYWTPYRVGGLFVFPVERVESNLGWFQSETLPQLAICHQYLWRGVHSYPGARREDNVDSIAPLLKEAGFDAAAFGDNHKGFLFDEEGFPPIVNCGGMMRRKSDEVEHTPKVWLLKSHGGRTLTIEPRDLISCADDKLSDIGCEVADEVDLGVFFEELESLQDQWVDFKFAIEQFAKTKRISKMVRKHLLESVEG
jgi:DNA repair exonuclease SbcCD nuclease subunit